MLQINFLRSIPDNSSRSSMLGYKGLAILISLLTMVLLNSGCKKLAAVSGDREALEKLFEENFLNKNFTVHFASDNGTDITAQYSGFVFVLTKTTSFYEGPMTGKKAGVTYTGTWTSNDDYGKLTINLNNPSIPSELIFINRSWRFTKKAVPIMELAPWGVSEPKVLHMERQ